MFDTKNIIRKFLGFKLNPLDISVMVLVAMIIVALLFFRSQKKEQWINLSLEVMNEEWWWEGVDPPYWYVNNLQIGDQARNSLGVVIGEISNVQIFEVGGSRKKALVNLKLKVTHDKIKNTFIFNYKPLEIGRSLNLTFGNNNIKGLVTSISEKDKFTTQMHDKQIWVLVSYLRPEYVAKYQPGLAMTDSLGREIAVIEDIIKIESAVSESFSDIRGQMVKTRSLLFKDVVLQLKIKTFESQGVHYFLDGATIKLGENIWIHFPKILAAGAEIIKIIE